MTFAGDPLSLWCYLIAVGTHLNSRRACGLDAGDGYHLVQGGQAAIQAILGNLDLSLHEEPGPRWLNGLLASTADWPAYNDRILENAHTVCAEARRYIGAAAELVDPTVELRALAAHCLAEAIVRGDMEYTSPLEQAGKIASTIPG
ncbi:MAG: hypothetical protein Q8K58_03935 [Acidimicrobiales bacterium]|nr:hypothetical protein [Acidimicrobiales bacterium]